MKSFVPELELRLVSSKKKYPITILTLHLRASDTNQKLREKNKRLSTNFFHDVTFEQCQMEFRQKVGAEKAPRENVTDLNI